MPHHGRENNPNGLPDRRSWRQLLGRPRAANNCFRGAVFVVGLVVLGGAVLWVFSTLLTAPVILAGLWIWSWEFVLPRRLLHRFMGWLGRFWERVRRRPTKWTKLTALGVLSGAVAYWASHTFGLL